MRNDLAKSTAEKKARLRKSIQEKRDRLDHSEHKRSSKKIIDKLCGLKIYLESRCIFAYYPFRSEIDTKILIKRALDDKKEVVLPRVSGDGLRLFLVSDIHNSLEKGSFGIMEPVPRNNREASLGDVELVIVPGVAFDKGLNRLGYGGGYYDRILQGLDKKTKKIALCFQMQIVESVPVGDHDKKVDMIITEERIYS